MSNLQRTSKTDWKILMNGTGTIWGPCGVEDVEEESVICGKCRTKLNKERDIAVTDDPAVQSTDHDSTVVLEHITKISGPPFCNRNYASTPLEND